MADSLPTAPLGVVSNGYGGTWWGSGFGAVDELEHVPDLLFPRSVSTYRKLRTDATVSSNLKVYNTPLTKLKWRIDPRGASDEAVRVCADSLGMPILGMDQEPGEYRRKGVQWGEHLRLALQYLVYGFMPFEPIYEVRDDGYAYLAALPERLPSTITGIEVNDDGTLKHVTQAGRPGDKRSGPNGIEIPGARLLWYVHEREGAVWTGRSFLRECYSPWTLKWEVLRADAIGLRRFAAGTPVMEPNAGTQPSEAQIKEAHQMAKAIRVGEEGGAATPGFTLRIKGVEGTLPDAMSRIRYYDEQMARAVLASVLDLGSTNSGNRALGDTFSTLLADGVQSIGAAIADTATELCRRLVDYNFGPDEPVPTIVCSDVKDDPQIIAGTIGSLVSAGVITPGPELEAYVREAYGLPAAPGGLVGFENEPEPVEAPAVEQVAAKGGLDRNRGNAENLRRAYLTGKLAARIRWGTSGDWQRCVDIASKHMRPDQAKGFCQLRHKEATGEYTGDHAHRVRGAEGDYPYRDPTPAEQAAGIDPVAIDEDHDALVALAGTAVAAAVAAWVAASAAALSAAVGGGLLALARVTLDLTPEGVAEALRGAMGLARRAGVEQGLAEARRAGGPTIDPDAVPDGGATEEDAEWADLLAERGAGAFEAIAKRAAQGQVDREGITEAVEDAARGPWFDALVYDAINYAMLGGRLQAMQHVIDAAPGTTWHVFHSGVRDRGQCDACAENDGTEYPDIAAGLVDFGLGRYRACQGMSRCRCLLAMSPIGPLQFGDPAFFRGRS